MSNPNLTTVHPRSPIFRLPVELILIITKLLSVGDLICLGITCHYMYDKVHKKSWDIIHATKLDDNRKGRRFFAGALDRARWNVLTSLEGRLPNLELCHFCRIFHPRIYDGSESLLRPVNIESCTFECDAKDFTMGRWSIWGLGFQDVHAIMNHHRLNGRCGLPLSHLRFSTDWVFADFYKKLYRGARRAQSKEFLSYFKLDTDAIIDDDQLILRRTQRLWVPVHEQGTDLLLRYGIGDIANDLRICSHLRVMFAEMIHRFITPFIMALKLVVEAEVVGLQSEDVFEHPLLSNCHDCSTQFQTSFHVHNDGIKSIEIVVDVWQNLGPCRSPDDPGWIGCWGRLNPRYRSSSDQWKSQWRLSNVKHPTQSQRDSFCPSAGKAHLSSSLVTDHWATLVKPKYLPQPMVPTSRFSMSAWGPLTHARFSSLRREVESVMIG